MGGRVRSGPDIYANYYEFDPLRSLEGKFETSFHLLPRVLHIFLHNAVRSDLIFGR